MELVKKIVIISFKIEKVFMIKSCQHGKLKLTARKAEWKLQTKSIWVKLLVKISTLQNRKNSVVKKALPKLHHLTEMSVTIKVDPW